MSEGRLLAILLLVLFLILLFFALLNLFQIRNRLVIPIRKLRLLVYLRLLGRGAVGLGEVLPSEVWSEVDDFFDLLELDFLGFEEAQLLHV